MPEFKFANIDIEKAATDFNNAVKEAAYVAVGLGVLGFQRAQVQRVELMKQLESQLSGLSGLSGNLNTQAEAYVKAAKEQVAELRTQLNKISSEIIPSEVPDAAAVRTQLAGLAKQVDEAVAPVRQQFEEQLDRLEEVLPQTAREFVQTVRGAAASQEQTIRTAVGLS
jgi:predicted  nucleic acid-binding Zn-ribbon protein